MRTRDPAPEPASTFSMMPPAVQPAHASPRFAPPPASALDPFPPMARGFVVALAAYVLVAVPKANALVPHLDALRPGKIAAVIVILTALNTPLRQRLRAVMATRTARCVGVITLLMVVGVPFSVWPSHSLAYFTSQGIQTFFLFALAAAAFTDRRSLPLLVAAWVIGTGAGAVRMLAPGALTEEGRVMMNYAFDPNDSAALLVCTLPFALWMATRPGRGRVLAVLLALASVLAIVKTGSRGGLLGLGAMGLFMLYVSPPKRRLVFIAAAVIGAGVVAATASDDLRTRFTAIFSDDEGAKDYNFTDREGRVAVWKRGIGYMASHPMLGVGVDGFETAEGTISGKQSEGFGIRYTAAHNSFVQIGAELGVFGLLSFVCGIAFAAVGLWRVRARAIAARATAPAVADQEVALAAAALSSLLGITSTGFFLSFGYHPITMFVWAMCIGVIIGSPFGRDQAASDAVPAAPLPMPSELGVAGVAASPPAGRGGRRVAASLAPRARGTPGWRTRGL